LEYHYPLKDLFTPGINIDTQNPQKSTKKYEQKIKRLGIVAEVIHIVR
jgi:hypothetical protein